jgi:hypothetical protein
MFLSTQEPSFKGTGHSTQQYHEPGGFPGIENVTLDIKRLAV